MTLEHLIPLGIKIYWELSDYSRSIGCSVDDYSGRYENYTEYHETLNNYTIFEEKVMLDPELQNPETIQFGFHFIRPVNKSRK